MHKGERPMAYIGYARLSTGDQSMDLQLDALRKAGCLDIYTEEVSGARVQRPELAAAYSGLSDGGHAGRVEARPARTQHEASDRDCRGTRSAARWPEDPHRVRHRHEHRAWAVGPPHVCRAG